MSKRNTYFHVTILCAAVVIGGVSLWHSGFWMEGRNKVPNFTFLSMVLLGFAQGIALRTIFTKENKRNH
jgi:undecaprenyl pyrophosphate phosphatase UppP